MKASAQKLVASSPWHVQMLRALQGLVTWAVNWVGVVFSSSLINIDTKIILLILKQINRKLVTKNTSQGANFFQCRLRDCLASMFFQLFCFQKVAYTYEHF